MASPPKQRERITKATLLTRISDIHKQAKELEQQLANLLAGVELQISIQPSLTTAARNTRASIKHLDAALTLTEAQKEDSDG